MCGVARWLLKKGEKGLLKSFRKRWFVYDDSKGLLKYYKQKGDKKELGYVCASNTPCCSLDNKL